MRSHEARRKSIHNLAGKQNKQIKNKGWRVSQLVEFSMHEALNFISSTAKLGVVVHACNPSPGEVEAGETGVQGYLWLYSETQANLDYVSYHLGGG